MPHNQKGLVNILFLLLLLAGIALGVYLVQQRTNLFPKATHSARPLQNAISMTSPFTHFDCVRRKEAGFTACQDQAIEKIYTEDTFFVYIGITSDIDETNSFVVNINFPTNFLEVTEIQTSEPLIKNWTKKEYDNQVGTVSLAGVSDPVKTDPYQPPPFMARIIFRAKAIGTATISVGDSQMLRSSDGVNVISDKWEAYADILAQQGPGDGCTNIEPGDNQLVGCIYSDNSLTSPIGNAPAGDKLSSPLPDRATALNFSSGDTVSARWRGYFDLKTGGTYLFFVQSGGGVKLKIDTTQTPIYDWQERSCRVIPHMHQFGWEGKHIVELEYFGAKGTQVSLDWLYLSNISDGPLLGWFKPDSVGVCTLPPFSTIDPINL